MQTVSIVTVSFNSAATIRDTVDSVRAQDWPAIEHIVVDGGSTDQTVEIVTNSGGPNLRVVSEPDDGIYDAMNKGIAMASGEYIAFLNSDDVYADSAALRRLIEQMETESSDCVFADLVYVDRDDPERILRHYHSGTFHPRRFRFGWMPAHPTFVARRQVYERHGVFDTSYRIAADYELLVRFLHVAGIRYTYLPSVVIRMRAGGVSTRGLRSSWILNTEIVRACRTNGIRTGLPLLMLKVPAKLLERIRRPVPFLSEDGKQR